MIPHNLLKARSNTSAHEQNKETVQMFPPAPERCNYRDISLNNLTG